MVHVKGEMNDVAVHRHKDKEARSEDENEDGKENENENEKGGRAGGLESIPNYLNAFATIPSLPPSTSPSSSPSPFAPPTLTDTPGLGMTPGGTLIVCPMTLISQWVEELRSKVHAATGMTVLMYYGSGMSTD